MKLLLIKVLYAGGMGVSIPLAIYSPFSVEMSGFEVNDWGRTLVESLTHDTEITVTRMSSWEAYRSFPRTHEALSEYDVILLSELEADTLLLSPELNADSKSGPIVAPNRVELLREFVGHGGGLAMAGGWYSFQGKLSRGGWHRTPIEEAFAFEFLANDDHVETPQGAFLTAIDANHPIMKNIPWEKCPPFLGYNRAILRKGSELLATIGEERDPLIAVRQYGKGRVVGLASSAIPHWGTNFVRWEYYSRFWTQVVGWLARKGGEFP